MRVNDAPLLFISLKFNSNFVVIVGYLVNIYLLADCFPEYGIFTGYCLKYIFFKILLQQHK